MIPIHHFLLQLTLLEKGLKHNLHFKQKRLAPAADTAINFTNPKVQNYLQHTTAKKLHI
jgi:hypothetical protein